jgi:hypothetical protein
MSKHRWLVVLPVLAGLVLAGSAVAQMMPRDTVRDSVYQTCRHNGVHFNKQGHPNCGLHKGWGNGDGPVSHPGGGAGGSSGDEGTTAGDGGHGHHGGGHGVHGAAGHGHGKGGGHGQAGTNHGHGGQGHGHSGGAHGNSGAHGHHGQG